MDTSNPATGESVSSRTTLPERKRQHRSPKLKCQIVEETFAPDASVARVAGRMAGKDGFSRRMRSRAGTGVPEACAGLKRNNRQWSSVVLEIEAGVYER
jgi:transposase-like protein